MLTPLVKISSADVNRRNEFRSLERSSDLSNSGEYKMQTASEIAILIHSFLRNCADTQSVSSRLYK